LVLYKKEGATFLVLTRRRDDLNSHAGQVSFPGGRREGEESLESTALREAHEEIGLDLNQLEIIGRLSCLYIPPTDYEVYPFVSWYTGPQRFIAQDSEVAEILEVSLEHLLDPKNQHEEPWEIRGIQVQIPYYLVESHRVWGATAMMLSEFLERIKTSGR
jgi:8-oxo-dGTP pyrophosphatase MutT (NUDIX family)